MLGKGCISVMVVRSILRIQTRPLPSAALWLAVIYIAVINLFLPTTFKNPMSFSQAFVQNVTQYSICVFESALNSQGYFYLSNMV